MIVLMLAGLLLGSTPFVGPPAGRAIKRWHSERLATQALNFAHQGSWNEAFAKARDSFQLDPSHPQAWRVIARLLSLRGEHAAALEWWKKIEAAKRLTLDDRRDYATAAFASRQIRTAEAQIRALLLAQKGAPFPRDLLLNAELAAELGDVSGALHGAERAATHPQATTAELLKSAVLVFSIAPPDSSAYARTCERLDRCARDPGNSFSLAALALLARQPPPVRSPASSVVGSTDPAALLPGQEIAARLETHPDAQPYHHTLAFDLRIKQQPLREQELIAEAVQRLSAQDDKALAALCTWLHSRGQFEKVLQVLPFDRATQRSGLFLQRLDALSMLGRWQEVADVLTSGRSPTDLVSQHMYTAVARIHLNEQAAAANEWAHAFSAADTATMCLKLGAYAERAGALQTADAAFERAANLAPKNRAAVAGQLRVARMSRQTVRAAALASRIAQHWPEDEAAQADAAYLRLLVGVTPAELQNIERHAEVSAAAEPRSAHARATLALARLQLGRYAEALAVFSQAEVLAAIPPHAHAIHAAALAANGWKEAARSEANTLVAAALLPEERALLRSIHEAFQN